MTVIVVDPASVQKYGTAAVDKFGQLNRQLQRLVTSVGTVRYHGTNAFEFKTRSADMAVEYATAVSKDMKQISDAVRTATSNIARSLGGKPITLPAPTGATVKRPAITKGNGTEEVDTRALEELIPQVKQIFASIEQLLDSHLTQLSATKWEGQAKRSAVQSVKRFTTSAKQTSARAELTITKYIRSQIDASTAADKTLS